MENKAYSQIVMWFLVLGSCSETIEIPEEQTGIVAHVAVDRNDISEKIAGFQLVVKQRDEIIDAQIISLRSGTSASILLEPGNYSLVLEVCSDIGQGNDACTTLEGCPTVTIDNIPVEAGSITEVGSKDGLIVPLDTCSPGSTENTCPPNKLTTTHILLLGNSYTARNQLPNLLEGLALADNFQVEIEAVTHSGGNFGFHGQNGATQRKISNGPWDYVVLQNQSQRPGLRPKDVQTQSLPNAQSLVATIRDSNPQAKIVYFATWGRQNGDGANCSYYPLICTFAGHTQALTEGYEQYANATGGDIAPVGSAWKDVVDSKTAPFSSKLLWMADGSHPTLRGSYLAASVLFGRIFNTSPSGNSFLGGLKAADATYLQETAAPYVKPCEQEHSDSIESTNL